MNGVILAMRVPACLPLTLCGLLLVGSIGAPVGAYAAPARGVAVLTPPWDVELAEPDGVTLSEPPVLRWPAVERAQSYRVQVSRASTFATTVFDRVLSTSAATPEADLLPGEHWWRYQVTDLEGVAGPWQGPFTFTVVDDDGPTLLEPAAEAVLTYPDDVPTLRWSAVAGVRTYQVEYATNPAFDSPVQVTTSNLSHVPTGLLVNNPAGTYHWRVRGVTTTTPVSYTKWSVTGRFSIAWDQSQAPQLLEPADGAVLDTPTFSWQAVPGASAYELVVALDDQFTNVADSRTLTGTTYVPRFTYPAKGHYWRVRAVDPSGKGAFSVGPYSEVRQFRRAWLTPSGALARPGNVHVDGLEGVPSTCGGGLDCTTVDTPLNRFLLAWDPVVGASHYEVEISPESGFTSSQKETCKVVRPWLASAFKGESLETKSLNGGCEVLRPATPTRPAGLYFDGDNAPRTDAYVRVRAVAASHDKSPEVGSAYSNQAAGDAPRTLHLRMVDADESGSVGSLDTPATLIAPVSGESSPDVPVLRWHPVPGATAYLVRLAKDVDFTTPVLKTLYPSDADAQYYVTAGTSFVPPESLKDNTAGSGADSAYYWLVLPCATYSAWTLKSCGPGTAAAIGNDGYWGSFAKRAPQLVDQAQATIGGRWASLSWTELGVAAPAAAAARHYEVEVTSGTLDGSVDHTTDASRILLSETALVPGTQYKWRVRAVDGGSVVGPWTQVDPASGLGVFTAPKPAGPVVADAAAEGPTPVLRWTPQAGPQSYEVQVFSGDNPGFPDSALVHGGTSGAVTQYSSYAVPTWLPAGTYSWRVRSRDRNGVRSEWTDRRGDGSLNTVRVGTPAPVLESPADGAAVSRNRLLLTWRPVPQAVRYRVDLLSPDGVTLVHRSDVVGTSLTVPTPLAAGGYLWQVTALVGDSTRIEMAPSPRRSVTVTTLPGAPGSTKVSVQPAAGVLEATWTQPVDPGGLALTGFLVRYREGTQAWVEVPVTSSTTSLALGGLRLATTYAVQVAARNADGLGPWSRVATARTAGKPGPVRSLQVSPAAGALRVAWAQPGDTGGVPVTGYRVEVRPVGSGERGWVGTDVGAVTSRTVTGLRSTIRYEARVAARNPVGLGSWAQYTAAVAPIPKRPSIAVAAVSSSDKLKVTVTPSRGSGYWSFRVQYRNSRGTWSTSATTYRTEGTTETKTINLRKGAYRVVVTAQHGYEAATSATVALRK
jgi:hypothetical protein